MPVVPPFLAVWLFHLAVLQGVARSETVCGRNRSSMHFVVGQPISEGEWTQQVSIRYNNKHVCGACLIAEQWVVTAARCMNKSMSNYTVLVKYAYGIQKFFQGYQMVTMINQTILNTNFSGIEGSSGGIALVKLSWPVTFTNNTLPICLPDPSAQFPNGTKCWVTQFQTRVDLGYPQTPHELEVPITCSSLFNINQEPNPVKEDMICTASKEGRMGACQVDSGGPVVCESDVGWVLAGIVNWGESCAEANHPGVYTSLPYYASWISEYIPNMTFVECKNCDRNAGINGGDGNAGINGGDGNNGGLQKSFSLLSLLGCLIFALL